MLLLVKQRIENKFPDAYIEMGGQDCSLEALVVSKAFVGLNLLKRQQLVFSVVQDLLSSKKLHALSLSTKTPDEWTQERQHIAQE